MALCMVICSVMQAQAQQRLRLAFAGRPTLTTPFIESMKDAGREAGLSVEIVPRAQEGLSPHDLSNRMRAGVPFAFAPSEGRNYFLIAVAQMGGLANVVVALDRDGEVAASVVRSGRFIGGARDASAKDLTKKLTELIR
jgi:hypothetical protein